MLPSVTVTTSFLWGALGEQVQVEEALGFTVTWQVAVLFPSAVVTVMVAEPAFTAVTLPVWSTVT